MVADLKFCALFWLGSFFVKKGTILFERLSVSHYFFHLSKFWFKLFMLFHYLKPIWLLHSLVYWLLHSLVDLVITFIR